MNITTPTFQKIVDTEEKCKKINKDGELKRATEIFYRLGVAFDRYILFSLDRYLGGAEIVWTDQRNFFNNLMITIMLLKKKLKIDSSKNQKQFLDIGDMAYNIRHLWFAPSCSFRLLDPIFQYFH